MNEGSILLFYYIIFTLHKFWNLCDLSKRSLLNLSFWKTSFARMAKFYLSTCDFTWKYVCICMYMYDIYILYIYMIYDIYIYIYICIYMFVCMYICMYCVYVWNSKSKNKKLHSKLLTWRLNFHCFAFELLNRG